MIKVLIVDDTHDRASALREALSAVPDAWVACTLESPLELAVRVAEMRPDVILIDTASPSRDVLEQLAVMNAAAPHAVVMFSEDAQDVAIRAAIAAGVSAYIVDGLAPSRLDPIMRIALERFTADQALRNELRDTKLKLADRKVIERAKGILMRQRGLAEEQAFSILRKHAMERAITLGEAAKQLVDIAGLLG